MSKPEHDILEALTALDNAVAQMRTANPKPDLQAIFARLEDLTRQLPPGTDSRLLHYLHKKSYQKARLFLEGKEAENQAGNCHGHV